MGVKKEFKSESAWQKWVLSDLKNIPLSWWYAPPTKARRGIPDIIGCVCGQFVALELKLDTAKPDKTREALQKHILKQMKDAGSPICVERLTPSSWPEVERRLRYLVSNCRTQIQKIPQE